MEFFEGGYCENIKERVYTQITRENFKQRVQKFWYCLPKFEGEAYSVSGSEA